MSLKLVVHGCVQAAGNLPAALPGGKPGDGPSAPSGPASYPTMLAPKHPDQRKEADASGAQAQPANGHAVQANEVRVPLLPCPKHFVAASQG